MFVVFKKTSTFRHYFRTEYTVLDDFASVVNQYNQKVESIIVTEVTVSPFITVISQNPRIFLDKEKKIINRR